MPEEYTIDFEVTGMRLPVDEILAASPPVHPYEDRLQGLGAAKDEQFVRCMVCVYEDNASYLELSSMNLRELTRTGTELVIAAWPCAATHEESPR